MLDEIKISLRIKNDAFDSEILGLIDSAKRDLVIAGINLIPITITPYPIEPTPPETEPTQPADIEVQGTLDILIKRAIITYVKANFGWDNPDAERLQQSYVMLKQHLALSGDYNVVE